MSSVNFAPPTLGQITDDARYNERNGLSGTTATQGVIWIVVGVPPNTLGGNGDFAYRTDGTEAGHTLLYHKEAGAWVATAA